MSALANVERSKVGAAPLQAVVVRRSTVHLYIKLYNRQPESDECRGRDKVKNQNARMDLRVEPTIKDLAKRASALIGSRSFSEFVSQAVREKATKVIEEYEVINVSHQSYDAFVAACEAPPAPNAALLAAQCRRKQRIQNGDIEYSTTRQETA